MSATHGEQLRRLKRLTEQVEIVIRTNAIPGKFTVDA